MNKASQKPLVSLSFFSGCGGLDLGLAQAGIHQKLFCDVDKACRQTLTANYPDTPVLSDILEHSPDELLRIAGLKSGQRPNLIIGGPPCQAFSTAGRRKGFHDPRGNVFLRYIELIGALKPDYAVIENVRGLLSAPLTHRPHADRSNGSKGLSAEETPGGALGHVITLLEQFGYSVSFNLYNSANYGVPQVRERIVLIAHLGNSRVPFLQPTHAENGAFGLKPWKTFSDAVSGLPSENQSFVRFPEERLKFYRMLGPGQYWKNLPSKEIQMQALGKAYFSGGGKTGFLRRLALDRPSPTLVTHPAMPATDLAHPIEDRPLSVEEYKRIQTFPDEWKIEGKLVDQYRQIGNAVPVRLGYAVGKAILSHMNAEKPAFTALGFPYSRYKNTDDISWRAQFARVYPAQAELFRVSSL